MHIKSIVAAMAITLIASVGSVSADEITVADTAVKTGTQFALLDGIATVELTDQELAATRGGIEFGSVFPSGRGSFGSVTVGTGIMVDEFALTPFFF